MSEMNVIQTGNSNGPLLVCVHGLMGHTHDFEPFLEEWGKHFNILIPDYAPNSMEKYYMEIYQGEEWLLYDLGGRKISHYLKTHFPGKKAFFAGISVGGKISLEIAGVYPEIFAGAVITDVGIGHLTHSPLCTFIEKTLPNINVKRPWELLRKELREKIPDRMLRILVQSHIEYPDKKIPEARWHSQGYKFYDLLRKSRMEDQWEYADKIKSSVFILKASLMSAIASEDYQKMQEYAWSKFIEIPNSGHFIQITHQKDFEKEVVRCLFSLTEKQKSKLENTSTTSGQDANLYA